MEVAGISVVVANTGLHADHAAGRRLSAATANGGQPVDAASKQSETESASALTGTDAAGQTPTDKVSLSGKAALSEEQLAELSKLQARDQQVRQHEMAHLAASGGLATSGVSFTYQKGPDGVNYAIGGEVSIDTSPGRTPEDTIQKARTIQAAALAPADPSGQDRAVAAAAQQMALQASAELAQESARSAQQANRSPDAIAEVGAAGATAQDPQAVSPENRLAQQFTQQASRHVQMYDAIAGAGKSDGQGLAARSDGVNLYA